MAIALGFQRELSVLAYLMSGTRTTLGKTGEMFAKITLEAHGYLADIEHERQLGDLRVVTPAGSIMRVEVKTARVNKDGYFQFCVERRTKKGRLKTSCRKCDAVILLGVNQSGRVEIYVLPAKAATNISIIKIPAKLSGRTRWKQYRQHMGRVNLNEIESANREIATTGSTDYRPIFTDSADWRTSQAGK